MFQLRSILKDNIQLLEYVARFIATFFFLIFNRIDYFFCKVDYV